MRLHLIRHGMTEANRKRRYCGSTDIPLSEEGRLELVSNMAAISYPKADVYISSGMARATETLRVIYDRQPDLIMREFREMDFGDFEMKSHDELSGNPVYERWMSELGAGTCPNGESFAEFEERISAGLAKLREMPFGSAVVISHGGVAVSIMELLFPGQRSYFDWQPANGRGYTMDISPVDAVLVSEI